MNRDCPVWPADGIRRSRPDAASDTVAGEVDVVGWTRDGAGGVVPEGRDAQRPAQRRPDVGERIVDDAEEHVGPLRPAWTRRPAV
jgi:hypothetical protein